MRGTYQADRAAAGCSGRRSDRVGAGARPGSAGKIRFLACEVVGPERAEQSRIVDLSGKA